MSHFNVYGQTHSPWVQAVLLGLHHRGISHDLTTVPPLEAFRQWGIYMPAARMDGETWEVESGEILQKAGYGPVAPDDKRAINRAWRGVMHRPDSIHRFFQSFAAAGDPHPDTLVRFWRNFWRSFSSFYFCVLIRYNVKRVGYNDPDNFGDQFLYWEDRLSRSDFVDGDEAGAADMTLFGILQCHASIPVPPLDALQDDERLANTRAWVSRMHMLFSDYPYLYSGPYFDPRLPAPAPASLLDRAAFYLGAITMTVAFPVTVPLAFYLISKVSR
jgi:glutathione S-transferase